MVQDVGHREVVAERGDDQRERGRRDRHKNGDAGASGCLTQSIVFADDGDDPGDETRKRLAQAPKEV